MLRIALSTLAGRKAGAAGAFVAVALAAVLAGSMGILLQSSLQAPLAVERLQHATVVVQGPTSTTGVGNGTYAAPLLERATIDPSVASRLQGVPGVARVVTDRSVYAALLDAHGRVYHGADGEPTGGHGWESSQLTPYAVVAGYAPRGAHDVVVDRRPRRRNSCTWVTVSAFSRWQARRRSSSAESPRPHTERSCRHRERSSSVPMSQRRSRALRPR